MKQFVFIILLLCALWKNSFSIPLIVPEELPSILSLVYSNIPPIKKGTDSRVGLGFRLGDHADFQVLFEIGPQTNTKPIGETSNDRKRYAEVTKSPSSSNKKDKVKEGSWMEKWAQQEKRETKVKTEQKQEKKKTVQNVQVPLDTVMHLYQLYGTNYESTISPVVNEERKPEPNKDIKKITADLSNIEFDDFK